MQRLGLDDIYRINIYIYLWNEAHGSRTQFTSYVTIKMYISTSMRQSPLRLRRQQSLTLELLIIISMVKLRKGATVGVAIVVRIRKHMAQSQQGVFEISLNSFGSQQPYKICALLY